MVEMDMRGDDDERLAGRRVDLRRQRTNAHAGVDQKVRIAALQMPDVGAHEIMHEGLGQHRRAGIDFRLAEPVANLKLGHRAAGHQTNGFPTLYFSGTSRFR